MTSTFTSRDADLLRALSERIDPSDPGAFNNLGVLYHSKGMHAEAVDAFLRAVALDPRMQTAARNLEVAAACAGSCDARLAALAERVAANEDDRAAAREQARLLRLIGRHAEAAHKLDALIAEDPDDAVALLERGLLEHRAGDLRRAQRWFERASQANPNDSISRLELAEVLYQRGHNEQSLEVLDALLAVDAQFADAHLLRGFVLGDMGQHVAGMDAAKRAAELNPSLATVQPNLSIDRTPVSAAALAAANAHSPNMLQVVANTELARYGLGLAFRQRGYFAEARKEFVRAEEHGEDQRLIQHAIAELDLIDGQYDTAIAAYESLVEKYGEQARWHNEHGVARHQRGDLRLAAGCYRRALRCEPRYALSYNNLGVVLADLGEHEAARDAFERATSIDPTLIRARLNLARWFVRHDNPPAALALLRELSAFHATNADVWHELGRVLLLLGRCDEAHRALASAVSCNPEHPGARYTLAQLLHDAGDHDGALRETQQALELAPMQVPNRLLVGIELQFECPDAAGSIDLLRLQAGKPLAGAEVRPAALKLLLPERPVDDLFGGAHVGATEPAASATIANGAATPPHCREGDAFAVRGLHGEALERYEQTRRQTEWSGPRDVWRAASLGECRSLCLLGRGAEALELLERVASDEPESTADVAEVLALLAAAHAARCAVDGSDARPARAAILQFLRADSRSAALLHFVGDVATAIGEDALALVLFRRALAVDPMRPSPRVAIARVLRRRNDNLAARLELIAALTVAPRLREALLELARLHCSAAGAPEALSILVQHLDREPTDVDALALLAETLVQAGRDQDARLALVRARRHDADHPAALWWDGTLLARQGRVREARERWSRLLAVSPNSEHAARARLALESSLSEAA